jgi:hypothetical protein
VRQQQAERLRATEVLAWSPPFNDLNDPRSVTRQLVLLSFVPFVRFNRFRLRLLQRIIELYDCLGRWLGEAEAILDQLEPEEIKAHHGNVGCAAIASHCSGRGNYLRAGTYQDARSFGSGTVSLTISHRREWQILLSGLASLWRNTMMLWGWNLTTKSPPSRSIDTCRR